VRHQARDIRRRASVAAEQPVRAEQPQIARFADRVVLQPFGFDAVLRVGGINFKISHKLIDLDRLEAEDRDIKTLRFQRPGQLRYFDRKTLAIPARVLRNPVVSNRKGAPSRRRKSRQHDHRYLREAEELCCPVAALAGDECPIFSHQQWVDEAEGDDAVCELANLLGGVGPGVTPVELDLIDRQRLHPHIHRLELACHALPRRSGSAIRLPPRPRVNSHVHSFDTEPQGLRTKQPQVTFAADRSPIDVRRFVSRLVDIWL
jgi:hypothetical protein